MTVALILMMQLSACGFNLRGSQATVLLQPMIIVEMDAKSISPFIGQRLKSQLEQAGKVDAGKVTVMLSSASFKKRVIVLDDNAHPAEQMLILQLDYTLNVSEQNSRSETLSTEVSYFFNSQSLVSADQHETNLKTRLLNQAADQIRNRLQFYLSQSSSL